jgi:hypothetical protein
MTTTPTLYTLEREVKRILTSIESLNEDRLVLIQSLKDVESELDTKVTYLNDFNKSIQILKHGKSNSQ